MVLIMKTDNYLFKPEPTKQSLAEINSDKDLYYNTYEVISLSVFNGNQYKVRYVAGQGFALVNVDSLHLNRINARNTWGGFHTNLEYLKTQISYDRTLTLLP